MGWAEPLLPPAWHPCRCDACQATLVLAIERTRAEERAAVVAYLRGNLLRPLPEGYDDEVFAFADLIERGEHR